MVCGVRLLSGTADVENCAQHVLPWIEAAGNPYYHWFFDDHLTCGRFLGMWLENPRSEIFIGRVHALFVGSEIVGGFIALGGEDLRKCRLADTQCLMTKSTSEMRRKIVTRLTLSAGLFAPVRSDEYYLSKIGVNHAFRGRGYGSLLMDAYLESGVKRGFNRYRLDVSVGNEIAMKCYEKCGFRPATKTATKNGDLEYVSMTCEC